MDNSGQGVNKIWNAFQQALEKSINKHIPHKTTELRKLIKKRDKLLYKRKKKSGDSKHAEETIKHVVQKNIKAGLLELRGHSPT